MVNKGINIMALTAKQTEKLIALINKMDDDDLNTSASIFNARRRQLQAEIATSFSVGQKVTFVSSKRGPVNGIISKINRKTIQVKAGTVNWKVSPSLLSVA